MKWFTCTPCEFSGGEDFFSRDSGLLSRGFRQIGVESRAVMPGRSQPEDCEDLIRTCRSNLESADWWRSHQLDGVVLYAWGLGRYLDIARAIRVAGARLVTSVDSSGLLSPYRHGGDYIRLIFCKQVAELGLMKGGLRGVAMIAKNMIPACLDQPRMRHLTQADLVAMVTPRAVDALKSLAQRFGHPQVAQKAIHLPHPQLELYHYDNTTKEPLLLSVGRWDPSSWFQKNPQLLISASERFLSQHKDYRHVIVGGGVESLKPFIKKLERDVAQRIELIPHVAPAELKQLYCRAQIGFWSSRHEGQQNAGAQALCCGASVVGTTGMAVNCFEYYASQQSGRQPASNSPQHLAAALTQEAEAWDKGRRDPNSIAATWTASFHSGHVAQRVLDLTTEKQSQ